MQDANNVILPLKVLFMIMQAFLVGCLWMTSVSNSTLNYLSVDVISLETQIFLVQLSFSSNLNFSANLPFLFRTNSSGELSTIMKT